MTDPVRYPMPATLAAMDLTGHHVVEASAGTGKTYLLERRVVDLLLRGGAPLEQILLVTFTEKATAELRRRVRALVRALTLVDEDRTGPDEPHWRIDDAARDRLRTALHGFDQAAIHTIHGFCHRVLLDSAFDGQRRFRQTQVATEAALRDALHGCMRDTLATEPGSGELLAAWIGRGRSQRVAELTSLMSDLLRLGGRIVQRYRPDQIDRRLADVTSALIAAGGPSGLAAALKWAKVHGGTVRAAVARAERLLELGQIRDDIGLPPVLDDVHRASAELGQFLERAPLSRTGPAGGAGATLADLIAATSALTSEVVPLAAAVAVSFLPQVRARLERDKAERGQFDFGDMLEQVWRALEGPGGAVLADRLRRRHPHALIDEFQDTDELQWKIFRRLYLEADGRCHLTIVGDPKQAIYGFRGADVHTYLAARRELVAERGEPVQLTTNYRSSAPLIEALGRLLGGDPPLFSGEIELPPIRAASRDEGGGPPLRLLDTTSIQGPADARRAALLRHVSREIAHLIEGGLEPRGPPVSRGSIFVLTRSTAESRDVAERLRQDGIHCALYQQEGLLQSEEAAEVRDLLEAVANPRDGSARLRGWQTRFFSVPLSELPAMAAADDNHPLVAPLLAWKELADRLDYERLFPRILADTRLLEREIALAPSERGLTNFLHLFELLQDDMLRARSDIAELHRRLIRWMADTEGKEEKNLQRLESDRDAVQIMTMHRSKGLEADVVFLFGGDGPAPSRTVRMYRADGERRVHIGKTFDAGKSELIELEERGENERLLYVALTRAARRLYLPCSHTASAGTSTGRRLHDLLNQRLQGWLASDGEPGLVLVEEVGGAGDREAQPAPDAADGLTDWQPDPALLADAALDRATARALAVQRGPITTSYTRIKRAERAAAGLEPPPAGDASASDADAESAEPRGPTPVAAGAAAATPGGRRVGVFLHEVLESIPLASAAEEEDPEAWAARPEVDQVFRRAARRHDVDGALPAWRHMVWNALRTPIDVGDGVVVPGVARATRHAAEVEFLFPLRDPAGRERALLQGAIDLVFEWQGRIYWLDWKSDQLPEDDPAALAAHVAAEYSIQAEIYSLALARMIGAHSEEEYRVRFGGLVYLFLRGARVHAERPSWSELTAREAALAEREVLG